MNSCQNYSAKELSEKRVADIKAKIKKTALNHLNSMSATSALSYYTKDATIISNGILYSSFESFAEEMKEFYSSLSKINLAAYDEMYINVITNEAALFTATFRYSFTSTENEKTDLQGVWTALYVRSNDGWKIRVRHESFAPLENK